MIPLTLMAETEDVILITSLRESMPTRRLFLSRTGKTLIPRSRKTARAFVANSSAYMKG
jgi:hypothetical protein